MRSIWLAGIGLAVAMGATAAFAEEAQKLRVDEILSRIGEQLAEKNLRIAKYYERTGSAEPANMYYQMVVDNWPNTKAAETAKEKISKK